MSGDYPSEFWRRLVEALAGSDMGALMAMLTEDVVLDWSRSRGPHKGAYEGQREIQDLWTEMLEGLEIVSWDEFDHMPIADDRMLVSNRWVARGRESRVEVVTKGATIYTLRDGKIARMVLFQSREEALGELGLPSGQRGD